MPRRQNRHAITDAIAWPTNIDEDRGMRLRSRCLESGHAIACPTLTQVVRFADKGIGRLRPRRRGFVPSLARGINMAEKPDKKPDEKAPPAKDAAHGAEAKKGGGGGLLKSTPML